MRRIATILLSVFILPFTPALTACTGSGSTSSSSPGPSSRTPSIAPTSAPTTSTASTATPSPTATTPLLTGAAVKPGETPPIFDRRTMPHDQGGAMAFAAYFYKALDWSFATTNANLLRPISDATCVACQQFIRKIDGLASAGGYSTGARVMAKAFAPAEGSLVKADYVVQVTISQEAQVVVRPGEASTTYSAPSPNPATTFLYISWRNGRFQALGISKR